LDGVERQQTNALMDIKSPKPLVAAEMPLLFLEGAPGTTKSSKYPISSFINGDLSAKSWTLVSIPLDVLRNDPANAALRQGVKESRNLL